MITSKIVQTSNTLYVTFSPTNYNPVDDSLTSHLEALDTKLELASVGPPPLHIYATMSYKVPDNTQVLYVVPIKVDGDLVVDGTLIKV